MLLSFVKEVSLFQKECSVDVKAKNDYRQHSEEGTAEGKIQRTEPLMEFSNLGVLLYYFQTSR